MVIMECTIALQCNSTWCPLTIDFANAHYDYNRGAISEELKKNSYFHFLIQIFVCIYGDIYTPRRRFGNGPDQPQTSIRWSSDGLRQGETTSNVFFNILAGAHLERLRIASQRDSRRPRELQEAPPTSSW